MADEVDVDAAGRDGGRATRRAPERLSAYPPSVHVLRDLGLEVEVLDGGAARGRLPAAVPAGVPGDGGTGAAPVPFGVLTTAVDVLAGTVCGRAISPDWMATSVMSVHLGDLDGGEDVVLDAGVLRVGRSTVTVEVDLHQDESVGSAVLSFSRLPRREDTLVLPDSGGRPGDRYEFSGISGPSARIAPGATGFDSAIGCRRIDGVPGRTETEVTPYVLNSFGAVNGGVVAAIADAAARSATTDPRPWHTVGLTVNLMGQGRDGPVVTTARVMGASSGSSTVRVEVRDSGQVDGSGSTRLMAVAHVVLAPG